MEHQPTKNPSTSAVQVQHDDDGHQPDGTAAASPSRRRRRSFRRLLFPVLLVVVIGAAALGYSYLQDQANYVSTDNAQVAGALVQVGVMNAGRVESVGVDVGDHVQQGEVLGQVLVPSAVGMTQSGTPRMDFLGGENQRTEVKSPVTGVIVARQANPGDTIGAGQPVVTVVDPEKLWVQAQIDETKVGRVRMGQPVEVDVDSLGKTLQGRVTAVNRASSATFSLLPASNASGNFTKVTQLVPVKIAVDSGDHPLLLGSSVEVRILVRD